MQYLTFDQIRYLQFDVFPQDGLRHGSFFRHGGVSLPPFESLNFSTSKGDLPHHIATNRQKVQSLLRIPHLCGLHQCHGTTVVEAHPHILQQADAMMTQEEGLGLMILHADCQAAVFYDPIHRAIAAVHCGWRGNVGNIYQNTLLAMHQKYGTKPADVCVGISPSLGPEAAEFIHYQTELPSTFLRFKRGACHFDLWEIARWQLLEAGVRDENIEIARICTYQNTEDCFSYRRSPICGHHATFIMLDPASHHV